jgi:hypothetical protein
MLDFANLDRCAAYVATRAAAVAMHQVSARWPALLADRARGAALEAMQATAEAAAQVAGSTGRRRCLRDAITSAILTAGSLEAAHAMGFGDAELDSLRRTIGRAVALLGMFLHASTGADLEPPPAAQTTIGRVSLAQPSPPRLTRPDPR